MNLTQRRLYMLSFVVTFLLTAPVLVFLAKGYSFDRIGGVFVHNGAITIKSNPKKVDLYLDGEKVSNKMLNIINNYYVVNGVRFGKHTIKCKKDGYTSWKKTIDVHSGISTEFWNILLFQTNNEGLKSHVPQDVKRFYLSPRQDDELVLYKEKEDEKIISIFTTNDNQENIVYSTTGYAKLFPDATENVEWSSNHKKLLVPALINRSTLIEKNSNLSEGKVPTNNDVSLAEENLQKDYIVLDLKNEEQSNINLFEVLSTLNFSELKVINDDPITDGDQEVITPDDDTEINGMLQTKTDNKDYLVTTPLKQPSKEKTSLTGDSLSAIFEESIIPEIHRARWMFDSDHQILILTKDHRLLFVDIEAPSQSSLLAENVNGFDLAGDHVYYSDLTTNLLWDIKPNRPGYKQSISRTHLEEDTDSFVKLFAYDELRIALITSNDTLHILNRLKPEGETTLDLIEQNVLGVQFSDDGKKLLYWTDKDFWTYMLRKWDKQPKREKGEKIFMTNFASGVKNVQWMETYENVLFTNNTLVKSAELDNRDQINLSNVLEVKSTPAENNYIYDKETSILYFLDVDEGSDASLRLKSVKILERTGLFGLGN